jgi:hypothetical protein
LVEQLLVGDFRVDESFKGAARADEPEGFGSFPCARRKLAQQGEIKELEFAVRGNPLGGVFQEWCEKKIETLRGPFVDGALRGSELQRLRQLALAHELGVVDRPPEEGKRL